MFICLIDYVASANLASCNCLRVKYFIIKDTFLLSEAKLEFIDSLPRVSANFQFTLKLSWARDYIAEVKEDLS